jgi:hypothetical protein
MNPALMNLPPVNSLNVSGDMAMDAIQAGAVFIAAGAVLPESLNLGSATDANGWKSLEGAGRSAFEQKVRQAGWIFFLMDAEITATVYGFDAQKALRTAFERITASVKSQKWNSLQITRVQNKSFLKVPCVSITAHSRHLQERPSLAGL